MTVRLGPIAAVVIGLLLVPVGVAAGSPGGPEGRAVPAVNCPAEPFQGAGRQLTAADLPDGSGDLRCAKLAGAVLTGLDLIQADLSGADLQGAKLSGGHLGQATLTGANLTGAQLPGADLQQADLTNAKLVNAVLTNAELDQADLRGATLAGADLSHATLDQVHAEGTDFTGADLTDASLIQAELGNAHLDRARLSGTDLSQADTAGTSFTGATGLPPWDLWLLLGGLVLLLILVVPQLWSLRQRRRRQLPGAPLARTFVLGLIGRVVLVVGIHLSVGALIADTTAASGVPAAVGCHGPQCALGVGAASWGLFVGVPIIIVGVLLMRLPALLAQRNRRFANYASAGYVTASGPMVSVRLPDGRDLVVGGGRSGMSFSQRPGGQGPYPPGGWTGVPAPDVPTAYPGPGAGPTGYPGPASGGPPAPPSWGDPRP